MKEAASRMNVPREKPIEVTGTHRTKQTSGSIFREYPRPRETP
jgi:hypothetical protein